MLKIWWENTCIGEFYQFIILSFSVIMFSEELTLHVVDAKGRDFNSDEFYKGDYCIW